MKSYKYKYNNNSIKLNLGEQVHIGYSNSNSMFSFYLTGKKLYTNRETDMKGYYFGQRNGINVSLIKGMDNVVVLECKESNE